MTSELVNTFHDSSGLVTVSVFRQVATSPQERFTDQAAMVAPDMVVIGGGASTQSDNPGALLTASYPNDQLTAWLASSKDHLMASPHLLATYAIGLSIQGMTRQELMNCVCVVTADSGVTSHPQVSATVTDPRFLLVSGGFRVDWTGAGNLATASFPSSDQQQWTARSKDHAIADPANLRVFAIALQQTLPVGTVSVAIAQVDSAVANHPCAAADLVQGFAMTGGGAEVHYSGYGNLLWRLQPSLNPALQNFSAGSKDHALADPCSLTAYSLGIKITPANEPSAIDNYIATLDHLPTVNPVPVSTVGPPTTTTINEYYDAVEQRMQGTVTYDEAVTFGADQSLIWAGSVLQGGHVLDTEPAPIPLPRNPITLTVSGLATKAGVSASRRVDRPTTDTVTDAKNELLNRSFAGTTPADLDVYVAQTYSFEHALARLGISVHYLGLDAQAQMSHSFEDKKASFVVNITQKYFTLSASNPGPNARYFDPSITPAEAAAYMSPGNPPVYVSSVTFGRRLILLMLTDARKEDFDADIKATYTWASNSVSGNASASSSSLLSESTIHLLDIGGTSAAVAKLLTAAPGDAAALSAIGDYIAAGANWSPDSPGSPIGWTLRYVDDAVVLLAADALDYNTLSFNGKRVPNSVVFNQDNSGVSGDQSLPKTVTPPPGTLIDVNSVQIIPQVYRGNASILNDPDHQTDIKADHISFWVYTQAADNGIFGHHSGGINVTVNYDVCGI